MIAIETTKSPQVPFTVAPLVSLNPIRSQNVFQRWWGNAQPSFGQEHSSVKMNSDWATMRILLALVLAIVPAAAQIPLVHLLNASRPGSDFRIGDRFEIVITAAPHQRVSVRTSRQGRTDWSPVVGSTDGAGHWSTGGQFEKRDFGSWGEIWTVGGKLASPVIQFSVNEGTQTFATPSLSDSFRTADGRLVNGRAGEQASSKSNTTASCSNTSWRTGWEQPLSPSNHREAIWETKPQI
jgi:hypothetical protein